MINIVYPVLIYDDLCYSCTKLAKMANLLLGRKALVVGHYSLIGKEIKKQLFPTGYDGLEMFWFITDGKAYGGRAGLSRLIRHLLAPRNDNSAYMYQRNDFDLKTCNTDCATIRGVFFRSCSILTKHKKFEIATKDRTAS